MSNKLIATLGAALFAVACSNTPAPKHNASAASAAVDVAEQPGDIVEVATEAGSFNTLLAAAKAAGLVDALRGDGPLTVFAPTDEAFAKLPDGTVEALLADPDALRAVLTYHVVAGDVRAKDVMGMSSAVTLHGGELAIDTSSGVRINNANVITADVIASNGVIHVIDTVLIPQ